MVTPSDFVVDIKKVDSEDSLFVGKKAADLGEAAEKGMPIVPSFVVTSSAYLAFSRHNKLSEKITHLLGAVNYESPDSVYQVARHIQKIIKRGEIPKEVSKDIFRAYKNIIGNNAVTLYTSTQVLRTSQNNAVNAKGEAAVADALRHVWAAIFTPEYVMTQKGTAAKNTQIIVRKLIDSALSGKIYTSRQSLKKDKDYEISARYGTPSKKHRNCQDFYKVDKKSLKITEKNTQPQKYMSELKGIEQKEKKVPVLKVNIQKATDTQIVSLAKIAREVEKLHYFPQVVKWVIEKNTLYITDIKKHEIPFTQSISQAKSHKYILKGSSAGSGVASGEVNIIYRKDENIKEGEIAVVKNFSEDIKNLKNASAVIVEDETRDPYINFYSKEHGIPIITDVPLASKSLRQGDTITLNASKGEIYKGNILSTKEEKKGGKTDIFLDIQKSEKIEILATYDSGGTFLNIAENIFTNFATHPQKLIEDGKEKKVVKELEKELTNSAKYFYPRPVIYKLSDLTTDKYKNMKYGKNFETTEANPLLGYHGTLRHARENKVLKIEAEAVKKTRNNYNNLQVAVPFVRTEKELDTILLLLDKHQNKYKKFKVNLMLQLPSNVFLLDNFLQKDLDGIVIDTDMLTTLTLALDNNNHDTLHAFDTQNPALLAMYTHIVKVAQKNKKPVYVYGKNISPALFENFVKLGVDAIAVSREGLDDAKRLARLIEKIK